LERIFKTKKVTEMTTDDIQENIVLLRSIFDRITEQNRRDALLKAKYEHDEKFTRIHKRIVENNPNWKMININQALLGIKRETDDRILYQHAVLNNEPFFAQSVQPLVITGFDHNALKLNAASARQINDLIVGEYMKEYRGAAST
jgi:type I restriction enzyme R subunit